MSMTTPIRPSLAQLLGTPQTVAPRPQPVTEVAGREAQRNFFREALGAATSSQPAPTLTPATFKAADVMRATTPASSGPVSPQPVSANSEQPIQRPGSYLNIRV